MPKKSRFTVKIKMNKDFLKNPLSAFECLPCKNCGKRADKLEDDKYSCSTCGVVTLAIKK